MSRDCLGAALWARCRHVEPGLHPVWAINRKTYLPGSRRERTTVVHRHVQRPPALSYGVVMFKAKAVLWQKWLLSKESQIIITPKCEVVNQGGPLWWWPWLYLVYWGVPRGGSLEETYAWGSIASCLDQAEQDPKPAEWDKESSAERSWEYNHAVASNQALKIWDDIMNLKVFKEL